MWCLYRHLFNSVFLATLSGVALFVFILITGNAMRDAVGLLSEGFITLGLFFELLSLLIPFAISFAMPMGMLIAILIVMGRLSANSEITAMRAAGISVTSISMPVLFVAVLGSGLAAYINSEQAPAARASYKEILSDIVRTDPLRFIVPKTFIHDFPGYVLYVADNKDGELQNFWLWELDSENRAVRLLRADKGAFEFDENSDALVLTLVNGFTELRDQKNPDNLQALQPTLSFQNARIRLPLDQILGDAARPRGVHQLRLEQLLSKRAEAKTWKETAKIEEEKELAVKTYSEIQFQISRRFAMAASVFSLALLGIPLGIKASRSETYANIALALAITMLYYVALIMIGWAEDSPHLRPDLLIWIPNILCQLLGVFLLYRTNRH